MLATFCISPFDSRLLPILITSKAVVSAVIINMVMAANADKKLGKYGRSNLWGRSENSVSAMGTPPPLL